jgi:hypothetical protein
MSRWQETQPIGSSRETRANILFFLYFPALWHTRQLSRKAECLLWAITIPMDFSFSGRAASETTLNLLIALWQDVHVRVVERLAGWAFL